MKRQRPNGEWLQESVEGVFNQSWFVTLHPPLLYVANGDSVMSYVNYKFTFTIIALGMFSGMFGNKEIEL